MDLAILEVGGPQYPVGLAEFEACQAESVHHRLHFLACSQTSLLDEAEDLRPCI